MGVPNAGNGIIGDAITYVGDQNYDTFGDIAVAETNPNGSNVTIHIYSGITGQPINSFLLTGVGGSDQTVSLDNAGDADGDGLDDLLIGQSTSSETGYGSAMVMTRLATQPTYLLNFVGEVGSRFGFAVATVDDLNGDGHQDYLVGAPNESLSQVEKKHEGAVYIFSGAASNTLLTKKTGPEGSEYGYTVTALKDWNGDGRGDFAVGAPNYPYGSYGNIGRVLIYDGPSMSLHDTHVCNMDEGERCGEAIADAGDLTDDGYNEILIGAPGAFNAQGSVLVFSKSYGYVDTWTRTDARDFGTSLISIDCPGCSSGIESFAGSHGYQNFEGALHRITAPLESVTDDYHSPSNIPGYSNALTAGDVNNDGRSDLIIGDPGSDRVYIYLK